MLKSVVKNVKIKGISSVVPPKSISLEDIPNLYNGDKTKIDRVMNPSGFNKRRVADENVTTGDLCYEAAKNLIAGMDIDKFSIDGVEFLFSDKSSWINGQQITVDGGRSVNISG